MAGRWGGKAAASTPSQPRLTSFNRPPHRPPRDVQLRMKNTLCLVWGPFGFRADELADAVGAERLSITFLYGPRYFAPIRYLVLFFRTLIVLATKRPDVI